METLYSSDLDQTVSFLHLVLDSSSASPLTFLKASSVRFSIIQYGDRKIMVHSSTTLNSSNRLIVAISDFSFIKDRIRLLDDKRIRIIPDMNSNDAILITGPGGVEVKSR